MNHFGATGENAVGHQAQIPAVVAQALGPLLLAVGIATGGHVIGVALEELLGRLINNFFLVVGKKPHNRQPFGSPAEVLHHGAQLAATGIPQLIISLKDQIPNDAHRSDHTRPSLYLLLSKITVPRRKV